MRCSGASHTKNKISQFNEIVLGYYFTISSPEPEESQKKKMIKEELKRRVGINLSTPRQTPKEK